MSYIILWIGLIIVFSIYNYATYKLTYKVELEAIRLHRIGRFKIKIIRLNNQIKQIKNKRYSAKALVRAEKKISKKNNQISILNNDIRDLENYGVKCQK